ncbi:MAG: hypothetical protein JWO84_600 [Parcubacteria group bacterium]|nr:hypothetical protein [Parcubacteria group bacterium]
MSKGNKYDPFDWVIAFAALLVMLIGAGAAEFFAHRF